MDDFINSEVVSYLMDDYRQDDPYQLTSQQIHTLQMKKDLFDTLVEQYPIDLGSRASEEDQCENETIQEELTYGELGFQSLGQIFFTIQNRYGNIKPGGIFYDLGSGTGKVVLASAILHSFSESRGVEILPTLYQISQQLKSEFDLKSEELTSRYPQIFKFIPKLQFFHANFFDFD